MNVITAYAACVMYISIDATELTLVAVHIHFFQ